ncbi:hypothetical protein SHKM778_50390 [Streptomyces sp. KM77-8]|uniref:Uncharacterized protein n=1 Tax=Streptomyces haneummycinicus TaxID=3074435 RepID=A0AAT9HMT1_9ACTN
MPGPGVRPATTDMTGVRRGTVTLDGGGEGAPAHQIRHQYAPWCPMPIRLFPGTRPGSAAPTAAIEQAGSPTAWAFAMRRAAAAAADEVYQVVVTCLSCPAVRVGQAPSSRWT